MNYHRLSQNIAILILGSLTVLSLIILLSIIAFVLQKGLPHLSLSFLFSAPKEMGKMGGIFPVLFTTILLPILALLIAIPLGVGAAIYLAEFTKENKVTKIIRFAVDTLAGIPSIIFGLFGFIFFVSTLKMGWSLLAGSFTLAIMVLPTMIRASEEAIRSVPNSWREVSLSLGATRWDSISKIVLPNALPGIVTGIMLSIGRSIGETAAVIFTAGSSLRFPEGIMDSARTMAVHFFILAREGISSEKAYATAAVLVLLILFVNGLAYYLMHRLIKRKAR